MAAMAAYYGPAAMAAEATTDLDNPPEFLPSKNIPPPTFSTAFKRCVKWFYPGLTEPARLPGVTVNEAVAAAVRAAARMPRWTVSVADAKAGRLEGYTTSLVWGLRNDVTFRFTCGEDGEVIVDGRARPASAMAGDFRSNATRIQAFFGLLRQEAGVPAGGCWPSVWCWKGWPHMW